MEINNYQSVKTALVKNKVEENNQIENLKKQVKIDNDDQKLKKAVADFSSIFLNLMFKSMRSTLPEDGYLKGGYAEEVFTDMLDEKVSELGSRQNTFKNLNKIIFEQLNQNR